MGHGDSVQRFLANLKIVVIGDGLCSATTSKRRGKCGTSASILQHATAVLVNHQRRLLQYSRGFNGNCVDRVEDGVDYFGELKLFLFEISEQIKTNLLQSLLDALHHS